MAQLTIYLDDDTIKRIENAAGHEHSSISKWVKNRLLESLEKQWPSDFFSLQGSLSEGDLMEPPELDFSQDTPREKL